MLGEVMAGGMGAGVHRGQAPFPEPFGSSASPCQRAGGRGGAWSIQPGPAPALAWGDTMSWGGGCHLLPPPPKQPLTSQALNFIPLPTVRHHLLITHNCSMLQIQGSEEWLCLGAEPAGSRVAAGMGGTGCAAVVPKPCPAQGAKHLLLMPKDPWNLSSPTPSATQGCVGPSRSAGDNGSVATQPAASNGS